VATLDPLPAGGPHALSATAGGATAEVGVVLVGDVWLCSGQSNMQMTLKDCDGGRAAADAAAKLTGLRLCSVGRRASPIPEASAEIRWRAASPESARDFSAVGFYFAAALLADPALEDVPVGVVDSSFGGSMCEAWVPEEALAGFAPDELRVSLFGAGPSGLYNAMIAPLGRAPSRAWCGTRARATRTGRAPTRSS
jgi:sialate O-acetylesterase